ncbi:MAG: hypothetical protein IJU25_03330 [Lachnospiraceae bacterium]|nr:hypothetical protein [Lachnospiraceae bacterium]
MRVELQNINQNVDMEKNTYRVPDREDDARMAETVSGYSLDIMGSVTDNLAYEEEGLKSVKDVMLEAGRLDVTQQRNYMAVMSNSMSAEDFEKLMKEGYHPGKVEIGDLVTNLDKIKATMAESGNVIRGYNDDLSREDMVKITGSEIAATEITSALSKKDLPVTEDNLKNMTEALSEAEHVEKITDNMMKYLLRNHMEPTVENLYKAEYSAGNDTGRTAKGYYRDTVDGYYAQRAEEIDWDKISDQVGRIAREAGLDDQEAVAEDAKWTINAGIPLTAANLRELHDLKQMIFPKEREELLNTLTDAIAVGKRPQEANLMNEKQTSPVTMKRFMEETRLKMSIEANYSLLRKGLVIETKELERSVTQLKEAEKELFGQALDVISEIALQPAESIQTAAFDTSLFTLKNLHEIGQPLQKDYEQAMKSYEAVWTAPRADLGDSIQKAFRNVDDILADLDEEINEVNRKTVRILGYTETAVTAENFERVQEATKAVLDVIEMMTPEKTLQMIRDGYNPLTESIYDLSAYLKMQPEDEKAEKYSEFIWKLDKAGEVSEAEKDAYIGLYRLLRQIEKNDGRPIGDVLNADEELTLQNLLSAVRSRKASGMDIQVDNAFGMLEDLKESGTSITAQITEAFERILSTAEDAQAEKEFAKQLKQDSEEAARVSDQVIRSLLEAEVPVNTDNLLAMDRLMHENTELFKKLYKPVDEKDEKKEQLKEQFADFVEGLDAEEDPKQAYAELMDAADAPLQEEVYGRTDALEVREMRLMHKQLTVARKLAESEDFTFPMEIGGELTGIRLKIIRGSEEAAANVRFDSVIYGAVEARFTIQGNAVTGYVAGESAEGISALSDRRQEFGRAAGLNVSAVSYLTTEHIKEDMETSTSDESSNVRRLYGVVKAFLKSI